MEDVMSKIIIYTEDNCPLCEDAKALLSIFEQDYLIEVEERNIVDKDEWLQAYQLKIPVIKINQTEVFGSQVNYETLDQLIQRSL